MPGSVPKISVILPAFDAAETIASQIAAICQQSCTLQFELIVVDDSSSDHTAAIAARAAAEQGRKALIISNLTRKGPNESRNIGVRASSGQFLLFCDADDVVAQGWMETLYQGLAAADLTGGCLDEELLNGEMKTHARSPASPVKGFDQPLNGLPRPSFANAACHRACWEKLGGADPTYFRNTDTEFFWRAQLAGYKLVQSPGAVVHYRHRVGLRANAHQAFMTALSVCRLYRDFKPQLPLTPSPSQLLRSECRWILSYLRNGGRDQSLERAARRLSYLVGYMVGLVAWGRAGIDQTSDSRDHERANLTGSVLPSRAVIVLEGVNGVGKSTVAKQLAKELAAKRIGELDPPSFMVQILGQNAFYLAEFCKLLSVLLFSFVLRKPIVMERSLLSPAVFEAASHPEKPRSRRGRAAIAILRAVVARCRRWTVIVLAPQDFSEVERRHADREPRFQADLLERISQQYSRLAQEEWIVSIPVGTHATGSEVCEAVLSAVRRFAT